MGLVLNRLVGSLTFPDLLAQLGIEPGPGIDSIRVHFGGPVETGRGFVLHSAEYNASGTMQVSGEIALTASLDILKDIAAGSGPRLSLLALGYAGWGPGQLDAEIQANGWLSVAADDGLIFDGALDDKWERAINKIGINASRLSGQAGHA
jgi:putative transcriptional regulator